MDIMQSGCGQVLLKNTNTLSTTISTQRVLTVPDS